MGKLVSRLSDVYLEELLATDEGWLAIAFVEYGSIPCDHFLPEFRKYAGRVQTKIRCCTLDVTENPSPAIELKVHAVPTTLVFLKGVPKARYPGPYTMEALEERIAVVLSKNK
jgi:thioredoxin-like negative regulator of GroEL